MTDADAVECLSGRTANSWKVADHDIENSKAWFDCGAEAKDVSLTRDLRFCVRTRGVKQSLGTFSVCWVHTHVCTTHHSLKHAQGCVDFCVRRCVSSPTFR